MVGNVDGDVVFVFLLIGWFCKWDAYTLERRTVPEDKWLLHVSRL